MTIRFIGQLFLSAFLGIFTALVLMLGASYFYEQVTIIRRVGSFFNDAIGLTATFVLACCIFFIVYIVVLQWRRFRYFGEVTEAIMHISEGNFDDKVPVRQRNELGELASFTNRLVLQLKTSMDEERRAEQTKNELITNVSHDLRTPLTSIIGYLGLIEQDRYRDEVELRHYVQIAYDKSLRLNGLISDLFEYTRMRNNTLPVKNVSLNLVELLSQLLEQYRIPLQQAGLVGELRAQSPKLIVEGEPNKLVRVFENLFSNAMTYGQAGKRIDIRLIQEQGFVVAEINNYGEAIPESDLPYLFDRFYRVDKSRTEHSGGSGLGLAIVKSIVEKHEGTISVSSDQDMTSFQVRLPLATNKESR
ncbi:sensor histidine kinase [Paenibacillaceae bacterium]|nr:sensor histidine kinase [Paenibacillaceae bacterium]